MGVCCCCCCCCLFACLASCPYIPPPPCPAPSRPSPPHPSCPALGLSPIVSRWSSRHEAELRLEAGGRGGAWRGGPRWGRAGRGVVVNPHVPVIGPAAVTASCRRRRRRRSPHHFFTDSSQILSNGSTAGSTPVPHVGLGLSLPHSLDMLGFGDMTTHPPLSTSPLAGQSGQSWRRERAHWSSSRPSLSPSRRLYKS